MCRIAVGMVLYNPDDADRVNRSLSAILKQVDKVYIFDNSTKDHSIVFPANVVYDSEHDNKGIAYALNRIMERTRSDGYEWLVTMDQDSVIPEGLIKAYEEHISEIAIGIICPQVIDSRRSYMEVKKDPKEEFVDFCITSASCTRVSAWEQIGGFDEWLFIDLVDNDFCKRMIVSGYKILRLNDKVLDQEFGKITPKSEQAQKFWNGVAKTFHNDNFGKLGYKKLVSSLRVYYTCRNIIYCNKKYKEYGGIGYEENYNCKTFLGFIIAFVIPSIVRGKAKFEIMKAAINGIRDGHRSHIIEWSVMKDERH